MEAHRPKGNAPEKYDEAFQYYVNLGKKRSLLKVAQKFTVSKQSVQKWSNKHNWQVRLKEMLKEASKKAEKKIVKTLADFKEECNLIVQEGISQFKEKLKNKVIRLKSTSDLKELIILGLTLRDQPGEITETRDVKYTAKIDENDRIGITESASKAERVH